MIRSLTGIRFYAALFVFISHLYLFGYLLGLTQGPFYDFLNQLGQLGVSVFFVLSGFVLFINYLKPDAPKLALGRFFKARFARIYPVFALGVLAALPIEMFSPNHRSLWPELPLNLSLLHCFWQASCGALNAPGWSISLEAFFYGCFPILGLLFMAGKPVRHVAIALGLYWACLVVVQHELPAHSFYAGATFPANRLGEFVVGMLGGYLYTHYRQHPLLQSVFTSAFNRKGLCFGLMAVLLLMVLEPVFLGVKTFAGEYFYLYYMGGAWAMILGLALLEAYGQPLAVLTHPWVILGGEISYSFYLFHHLIMRYVLFCLKRFGYEPTAAIGLLPGGLLIMLLLSLSLGCAVLMYRWVEVPVRRWILNPTFPVLQGKLQWHWKNTETDSSIRVASPHELIPRTE